eukprot:TRINITY_DN7929_c0_g1_i1.p1 TRINITY_DN7929_c0_g1~~TRINITY_DN7929_c0_g1_i1.p1  ORF type:complete len:104 (+),score=4.85 TRINITY_DN7929_c0_g1_i1:41-352(+)
MVERNLYVEVTEHGNNLYIVEYLRDLGVYDPVLNEKVKKINVDNYIILFMIDVWSRFIWAKCIKNNQTRTITRQLECWFDEVGYLCHQVIIKETACAKGLFKL